VGEKKKREAEGRKEGTKCIKVQSEGKKFQVTVPGRRTARLAPAPKNGRRLPKAAAQETGSTRKAPLVLSAGFSSGRSLSLAITSA
jgi:hypothetical protein